MNKIDSEVKELIHVEEEQGKYTEIEDNILKELEPFQSFLYCHVKDTLYCKQMLSLLHQPARFFATANNISQQFK